MSYSRKKTIGRSLDLTTVFWFQKSKASLCFQKSKSILSPKKDREVFRPPNCFFVPKKQKHPFWEEQKYQSIGSLSKKNDFTCPIYLFKGLFLKVSLPFSPLFKLPPPKSESIFSPRPKAKAFSLPAQKQSLFSPELL